MEHTLKELFQLAAVYAGSGCGSCSAFLSLEGEECCHSASVFGYTKESMATVIASNKPVKTIRLNWID